MVINFLRLICPKIHYKGIHHYSTPGATGSFSVHIGTGNPVARDEDRNLGTIPMPTFARRPSIMSSLFVLFSWTAKTADIGTAIR